MKAISPNPHPAIVIGIAEIVVAIGVRRRNLRNETFAPIALAIL